MSKEKNQKRQPYKRPKIKVIELAADEVLGGGCKSNTGNAGKNEWLPGACTTGFEPCSEFSPS